MATSTLVRPAGRLWLPHVLMLLELALLLCLASCTSGGDEGQATAPSAPSPRVER